MYQDSSINLGIVEAKTDRLDGIVHFKKVKNPNDLLNEWSHNVSHLMELVQKTTHLINKEEMVHKHLLGSGGKVEAVWDGTFPPQLKFFNVIYFSQFENPFLELNRFYLI